jgi:hypothetical protein
MPAIPRIVHDKYIEGSLIFGVFNHFRMCGRNGATSALAVLTNVDNHKDYYALSLGKHYRVHYLVTK